MLQKWILGQDDVQRIAAACRAHALREGWAVSIAIVDDAGGLLYFERLGARVSTIEVATRKARTAAYTRAPSAAFAQRAKENTNFLALDAYLPLPGGMPLLHQGECVGAVGVSGVLAEQDELVARAGCDALTAVR
jgi:glc operon protein GlcG